MKSLFYDYLLCSNGGLRHSVMQVAELPRLTANGFRFRHAEISPYTLTWTSPCTQHKLAEVSLQSNLPIFFSSTLQGTCTQMLNSRKGKGTVKVNPKNRPRSSKGGVEVKLSFLNP